MTTLDDWLEVEGVVRGHGQVYLLHGDDHVVLVDRAGDELTGALTEDAAVELLRRAEELYAEMWGEG